MSSSNNFKNHSPFVATLIDQFVPDHIRANYPQLIAFIEAYLGYLEESNESGYFQNALPQQRDIRTQEKEFLRRIEQEIGLFVPREYEATPLLFYDKISELWRSKGSQEAIETFFRLFLNDTVQIRFPWDFVLKPSDGRWEAPRKLRVSIIRGDANDFASKRVQQIEEYGLATVTKVERKVYADQTIFELTILRGNTVGNFKVGNRITTEDRSVEAEIYNSVSDIVVETPGTNYEVGDRIRLEGRSRISFEARVSEVNGSGGITDVDIIDFGSGTTPNHIFNVQGSGKFYLDNFTVFQYLEDNRELDLGDNLDISEDSIEFLSSDEDYTLGTYFGEFYVGRIIAFAVDESLVDTPLQTSNIITTPTDPTEPLNFKVDSLNGIGATFSLEFAPIVESAGYYDGVRGQLSEAIVLQDSEFYQKFSYEVVTAYPINEWIDPLKRHVHPAGTKPFGLINRIERLDAEVDILSNSVREIIPQDSSIASQFVAKSFTKRIGDGVIGTDDTSVLSQEDISFTKRIFESASNTDSGLLVIQDYTSEHYFSADYVSKQVGFIQDYAEETYFAEQYIGNDVLADVITF